MDDIDLIGVFLVKSDSKGHRLLSRYPYRDREAFRRKQEQQSNLNESEAVNRLDNINEFSDDLLSTLFEVKSFCDGKFELKINDIRFIGQPTTFKQKICPKSKASEGGCQILINIVFALQAIADYSIVKNYHNFSKLLGIAIRHEEERCSYFSKEMKIMQAALDSDNASVPFDSDDYVCAFDTILEQSSLARNLEYLYTSLCSKGIVHFRLNNWIEISFCQTQKAHAVHLPNFKITQDDIDKCLHSLKPYHGILLLEDLDTLLNNLPPDSSPTITRFLKIYSPLKNFQIISADSDLTLAQVYNVIAHLLYWGYAMIIFPLCESNIYVISSGSNINYQSHMVEKFAEQFPGYTLLELLRDFSLPSSLSHKMNPLTHTEEQAVLVQMVAWMLRHRLLAQLHTYLFFMPTENGVIQLDDLLNCSQSHSRYSSVNMTNSIHSVNDASESEVSSVVDEDIFGDCEFTSQETCMTTFRTEENDWLPFDIVNEIESLKIDEYDEEDFMASLSKDERNSLQELATSSSPEDFHLLMRLLKQGYLQGNSHLEEIMYLENITRSQLVQLIEKFGHMIVTCECEDPAVSYFYPNSHRL